MWFGVFDSEISIHLINMEEASKKDFLLKVEK